MGAGLLQQDDKLTEAVEKAKERLEQIESGLRSKYDGFLAGLGTEDLSQLATYDRMAIIVHVLTEVGGAVILVTAQGGVRAIQLPDFDL